MQKTFVLIFSFISLTYNAHCDIWDNAVKSIRRIAPSEAHDIPSHIVHELEKEKCLIPQPAEESDKVNFIKGEFVKRGQTDWIVICSKEGKSKPFFFWGGESSCNTSDQPDWENEKHGLQGLGPPKHYASSIGVHCEDEVCVGYSKVIARVDRIDMKSLFDGENLTWTDEEHDAIEYVFIDKASYVSYCKDGKWINFRGTD